MATYTVTGDVANLVGDPLTNGGAYQPRAWLVPYTPAVIEAGDVRLGSVELTLDSNYEFSQTSVPEGVYAAAVDYYDAAARQRIRWQSNFFELATSSDLSALLSLPAFGGSDGELIVPVLSANSGTSYAVTAPTHNERRLKLTLTGSPTLTLSGGTAGEVCSVQLHLIQDGTGSRTITWPGNVDWGLSGAPVLSTVAGKIDIVYLTTDDGGFAFQGALVGMGY